MSDLMGLETLQTEKHACGGYFTGRVQLDTRHLILIA